MRACSRGVWRAVCRANAHFLQLAPLDYKGGLKGGLLALFSLAKCKTVPWSTECLGAVGQLGVSAAAGGRSADRQLGVGECGAESPARLTMTLDRLGTAAPADLFPRPGLLQGPLSAAGDPPERAAGRACKHQ